ncbi:MAG: lamin tail domain-containing protein, partial [Bacteroidales bacterium]|nr:lamin tail domain-containing protein [Bacteroidales bacterium]
SDFVELYNGGNGAVSLQGWYLSDSTEKLTKWALPNVSIAPGEYLLIFLSGKDRDRGELHASFALHAGETVALYNSAGRCYDAITIPETEENVSVGRSADKEIVFYSHPTPLEENGNPLTTGK